MNLELLAYLAVFVVGVGALSILVIEDWRIVVAALVLQYMGVFALAAMTWPLALAAVKFIAGFIAAMVLGLAKLSVSDSLEEEGEMATNGASSRLPQALFRLLAAGMVFVTVVSVSGTGTQWVPGTRIQQFDAGLTLIGLGLLHLGFTAKPFKLFAALLTVLAGYEIIYASVENSLLVAGLLAGINLGLALVGAYLITLPERRVLE